MKTNKKKKKEKKGFTLVELLVAITILGIILAIAIPQVLNLQNDNKTTKYDKYAESLISSGKLYTDSYAKDMFGNNTSGCYDIPYSELKSKNLAKDIKIDGANCNTYAADGKTPLTYVKVLKSNENYSYQVAIKCVDKNGKTLYEKTIPGEGICDGTKMDEEGPGVTITPDSHDWYNGKKSGNPDKVTVKVSDLYGLAENTKIQYAWQKAGTAESSLAFKTKDFKNKRGEGTTTNPLTTTIEVPQGVTGEYTLIIKTNEVRDANGIYMTQTTVKSNIFKLDNTKPVITSKSNSKDGVWTNSSVEITASATDSHSGVTKIYYTYSNSNAQSGLLEDWNKKTPSGNNLSVAGTWTAERENNVYLIAVDKAGNQSDITPVGKIMIDKTKPTIDSTTNSSGSKWTNSNVTITAKASDNKSGIKKIYYTYTASSTATKYSDWNTDNKTSVSGIWSAARNNEVFIVAEDNAGNVSAFKSTGSVKIDKTAPTISNISNPSGGNATASPFALTLSGSDSGGSGLAKWRYSYDNSSWTDYANSNKSPFTTTNFSAIRNQDVYISLCDVAGNCSTSKTTRINIVDQCSSTREECGNYGSCQGSCGTGTKYRTCQKKSNYTGANCGSSYQTSASCETGKSCGPPSHTHSVGVLGTTLKPCNWTLSCGTYHPTAYYGYCGVCWNYGKIVRVGTSKYCPGKNRDGCKNWATLYPTVVPD